MIPLALAASGRWRCFAAAAATVVSLTLATTLVFGAAVWHAFFVVRRIHPHRRARTGQHRLAQNPKHVLLGAHVGRAGSAGLCDAGHSDARARRGFGLAVAQRRALPAQGRRLCLATILATPYSLDYDMMVLAPAIAFLAADGLARGFGPWEKTALAALWLVPLVARTFPRTDADPAGRAGDAGDVCFDPAPRGTGSCAADGFLCRPH